jgi:GAF domain-containing protein
VELQPDTVRQMASAFTAGTVAVDTFLRAVCQLMVERLRCNRVTVWRFEGPLGLRTLHCVTALDTRFDDERFLPELTEPEYGDCFAALVQHGYVESADVRSDPRLRGLLDCYLEPLDIRSLLDVGFSVNGRTVGLLCCEQVGEVRRWQPTDIAAVRRVGTTISLALTKSGEWEAHFPDDMPVTRS